MFACISLARLFLQMMRERDRDTPNRSLRRTTDHRVPGNERKDRSCRYINVLVAVFPSGDPLFRDYSHIVWLQRFDRVEYRTPFANARSFLTPPHTHPHI